jgi:hypothetical protein
MPPAKKPTKAQRMAIMREIVEWLREAPDVEYMGHSATNGVGLARRRRPRSCAEAADELERQIKAGTA